MSQDAYDTAEARRLIVDKTNKLIHHQKGRQDAAEFLARELLKLDGASGIRVAADSMTDSIMIAFPGGPRVNVAAEAGAVYARANDGSPILRGASHVQRGHRIARGGGT